MSNKIFLVAFVIIVPLLLLSPINALAQTNMTSIYSNASKVLANASKLIHQALTNPPETPAACIKITEMSPTVQANKTIAENPLSLWAYTAGMNACTDFGQNGNVTDAPATY